MKLVCSKIAPWCGAALLLIGAGCGSSSEVSLTPEEQKELAQRREESQEAQRLQTDNNELPRLQKQNEEIARLRDQQKEAQQLQGENEQLRTYLTNVPKIRPADRPVAAAPAPLVNPLAAEAEIFQRLASMGVTNETGDLDIVEGDQFYIDRSLLPKLIPQYPTNRIETGQIEVKALLTMNQITNVQQLFGLGITNFNLKRAPAPADFQAEPQP
jgi:hypothetical protein